MIMQLYKLPWSSGLDNASRKWNIEVLPEQRTRFPRPGFECLMYCLVSLDQPIEQVADPGRRWFVWKSSHLKILFGDARAD